MTNMENPEEKFSLQVQVLPLSLRIGTVAKEHFHRYSHAVLKFLLNMNQKSSGEQSFFNMSETPREVSFVVEEHMKKALKALELAKEPISFTENMWIALQVSEGAAGFQGTAVVQKVSSVLADNNISIFFVSTFSEDYVLVGEAELARALGVLREHFLLQLDGPPAAAAAAAAHARRGGEGAAGPAGGGGGGLGALALGEEEEEGEREGWGEEGEGGGGARGPAAPRGTVPHHGRGGEEIFFKQQQISRSRRTTVRRESSKDHHPLSIPQMSLKICRLSKMHVLSRLAALTQLFFFPEKDVPRFLSYTETEAEITVVLPEEWAQDLELAGAGGAVALAADYIGTAQAWQPIQIGSGSLGLVDETGIVARFSDALSRAQVDIFYISTFVSDFGMVPSEQLEVARAALNKKYSIRDTFFTPEEEL